MNKRTRFIVPAILTVVLLLIQVTAAQAEDADFSCMSFRVWDKSHLSNQYMDHDIVLQNDCPGSVYWSMCIERVDPWTNEILETHSPMGYLEAEKKARVNLHLQRSTNREQFRNRFQEFYVNFGYGIEAAASATCIASGCEGKKRDLREQIRANERAWERAENSLSAEVEKECPAGGWDATSREECSARIKDARKSEMQEFASQNQELRANMAAIDPEHCQIWSGGLTGE
jgi:hypothetical protein